MGKLSVGQELVLDTGARETWRVVVQKVGRKWADIGNPAVMNFRDDLRINMDDMSVGSKEGRDPWGWRCYLSHEAMQAEKDAERRQKAERDAWIEFRNKMPHSKPPHVTTDAIYQAASLLGIELPARSDTGETK